MPDVEPAPLARRETPEPSSRPPDAPPGIIDYDGELVGPRPDRARRRFIAFEILAVVCLAVVPDVWHAIISLRRPQGAFLFTNDMSIAILVRSFAVTLPVIALIRYSHEPHAKFGLVRPRLAQLVAGGLAIAGVAHLLWFLSSTTIFVHLLGERHTYAAPTRPWSVALFVVAQAANAIAEELVMRSYLIPRFEDLTRHAGASIVGSTILFASYHAWQGPSGIVSAVLFGLIAGIVFRITRSIGPVIAGHFVANLLAFYAYR